MVHRQSLVKMLCLPLRPCRIRGWRVHAVPALQFVYDELDVRQLRTAMDKQGLGQSEMVVRSGVSRAQLSRLLSRDRVRVREQTIARLAEALRVDTADLATDGRRQAYLDWVARAHAFVDFRGLGLPQFQRQEIEAIFVEPEVLVQESDDDCDTVRDAARPQLLPQAPPLATDWVLTQDRKSLPSGLPFGVVVDTRACLQAPDVLWLSGVGDLIAKLTAIRDWKLAYHERGEPVDDLAALLSTATVYQFIGRPVRDLEGVRLLATALSAAHGNQLTSFSREPDVP